jgi:hypothetical protein
MTALARASSNCKRPVLSKKVVFWDLVPCSCGWNRRFGWTYRLHLQGRWIATRIQWTTTTTRHQIPEDDFLHRHRRENLKSYDLSSRQRGRPTWTNSRLSESNRSVVFDPRCGLTPGQAGQLTIGRNITLTWLWLIRRLWLGNDAHTVGGCEKLVAEAGNNSGTQSKGNVGRLEPIRGNGSEDVTVNTAFYCKV